MLIAQVTDLHIGFDGAGPDEPNRLRLESVIDRLLAMPRRPDLMIATGDLTEHGDTESYAALKTALVRCPWPVWPIPGNHDLRAGLRAAFPAAFPDVPASGDFIQYAVDAGPLRILMLDTLEEGCHAGAFCDARARWLDAELTRASDRPTLIALHHPPIDCGIGWMAEAVDAPWIARLGDVIARHPQVLRIVSGHVHRPILSELGSVGVWVCPSTAPQVALDLREITPTPDGRDMIVAEPPAFGLHLWTGKALVSHVGYAGDAPVLARYTDAMRPLVQGLLAERG